MAVMYVVAILLVAQMLLLHFDKLVTIYYFLYKKIFKPKFEPGEKVLINYLEHEVVFVLKKSKPYTYFCLPVYEQQSSVYESYYHESEIHKKTGVLKELE
jgi:hypothetical protein